MPKRNRFWNSGSEKIANLMQGENVKTDQEVNLTISEALNSIFTGVIQKLKEDQHKNVSVEGIQNAIQKLLPSSMADHAVAEGFKEILLYNAMPYDFAPKKKVDELYMRLKEKIRMQDEADLKSSYTTAVNEVMKNSHTDARLDKNSNLYVSRILDSVSTEVIKRLNQKNANKLTLEETQKIVKDILPKELSKHAAAEGNKMLFKFESRGLQFVPGATVHQRVQEKLGPVKKTRKFTTNGYEFKSGVVSIVKLTHPGLKFNHSGEKVVCQNVDSLCDAILEKIGKKGAKKTQGDIEKAVKGILPPVMAENAIAEAKKLLKRQESGEIRKLALPAKKDTTAQKSKAKGLKLEDGLVGITIR